MTGPVKGDRRAQRKAETEDRLVQAATARFLERGYVGTTLAEVAELADLAPRTLYVRFATKAELLQRCIGVAIAGDVMEVPIAERPWMADAMEAPTLAVRIERMASITARLMERAGPLLAVAMEAAPAEPTIAAAAQAGRHDTARTLAEFWRRAAGDGLLPPGCDLPWLTDTATLLAHAETYLLITKTTAWDLAVYESWLMTSWARLVHSSAT